MIGLLWIPYPGIQNDEALFAAPIFPPAWAGHWFSAGSLRLPVMLMSYLGAAKSWLYWIVFQVWAPTPAAVRIPMLLAGAVSIWLFYRLAARMAGTRAAVIGAALLATDTTYLLTIRCDWGPVALQHLFVISGVLLVVRYWQERSILSLGSGFFLLGMACWDKALSLWVLSGLAAGVAVVFPRELWKTLNRRTAAAAVLGFCLGSLPLIVYNLTAEQRLATLRSNATFDITELPAKARFLAESLEGSTLFAYWVRELDDQPLRRPREAAERVSVWLSGVSGEPRRNLLNWCLLLALALVPVLWRTPVRRVLLFSLVVFAVAWFQMGITRNAGGGIHHTVLLWPLPHLIAGAALGEASRRFGRAGLRAAVAVTVLVCGSGLLLTNHYYSLLIRAGGSVTWTDAIYPLATYLRTAEAKRMWVLDWGLFDTLRLLNRGTLPLHVGSEPFSKEAMTEEDREQARRMAGEDSLFLAHTPGNEFDPRVPKQMETWAARDGYQKRVLVLVRDRNGRAMFEVFRMERISGSRMSRKPGQDRASRPAA